MMMMMLEAGGIPPLQDGIRTADDDNPKGYYELEQVKKIKDDHTWLAGAKGTVVKLISELLLQLPPDYNYKVVFMRRKIDEILASQKKMLVNRGTYDPSVKDVEIKALFLKHLDHVFTWINANKSMQAIFINYNILLDDPAEKIRQLNDFLGGDLDTTAMAAAIDQKLYRNRA